MGLDRDMEVTPMKRILIFSVLPFIIACSMLLAVQKSLNSAHAPNNTRARAAMDALPEPPALDKNSWELALVNFENPLPEGYTPECIAVEGGWLFDSRAASALTDMLNGCRAAGFEPVLLSTYRTREYQAGLYENKVQRVTAERGCSLLEAESIAAREVARPGTSEHELGLAADIATEGYGELEAEFAETPIADWLRRHCAEYGFILRYPEDSADITGVIFEPWHFRYVGREAAGYIMENGLTLEEFLGVIS